MATNTKVRPEEKVEESTVHVRSETEQDFHLIKELQEKAGDRIRERLLTTKLSPESREDLLHLAQELEESVPRLAKKSDGTALIAQVDKALDKFETYIAGVAEKEAAEEKEKKKKEEKEVHPHSGQKPKSADEITKEKADAKLKELRAEIRGEKESTALSATEKTKNAIERNKNVQQLKAEEEAYTKVAHTEVSQLTGKEISPVKNEKAAIPLDQLHKKAFGIPTGGNTTIHANNKYGETTSRGSRMQRVKARTQQATQTGIGKLGTIKGKVVNAGAKSAAAISAAKNTVATAAKVTTAQKRGVLPTPNRTPLSPPKKESGTIKFTKGLFGGRLLAGRNVNDRSDEDERLEYNFTESESRYVTASSTEEEVEIDENTETTGQDDQQESSNNNADPDQGRNRWRPRRIPKRIMGRPGVPGLEKGLGTAGKGLARAGAQAGMALMRTPHFWIVVAIILLALFLFFIIFGEEKRTATDTCVGGGAATETIKVAVTGAQQTTAGQSVTYTVLITDTRPVNDVTVTATIPPELSALPADISSSWARFTTTGNTITWRANENGVPATQNPPNITFTFTTKAVAANTNAIVIVDAVPAYGTPPPAALNVEDSSSIMAEPSQAELKRIYGGTQAEVEANLVTINFQGKSIRVHKLVQGAFEKVNTEITAANTGYNFRSVGSFAWRTKNIPGRNSTELSTHSFGITVDINPDTNPYTTANTHDIPPAVADAFKRNGFAWGGDWQPMHDWMHFQYEGAPGAVVPGGGGGTNCPPAGGGGGGPAPAGWVAPSANNCMGRYRFTSPLRSNFGDPECNFDKNLLYNQLKAEDPANADVWFNKIVPCESGFNPNAYAGHAQIGTPDAAGAWGLYQMGSAKPPGSAPPAPGKNGVNDRGDVPWNIQTTNATTYGKRIGSLGRYWACAR